MVAEVANSVGFGETEMYILPLLEDLSNDTEPAIKQILAEQPRLTTLLLLLTQWIR
jgi:hypothetical protein